MIKPINDINGFGSEKIPTAENWKAFAENEFGASHGPDSYCDATYDIMKKIEPILQMQDFQQMSSALTELYEERYNFLSHALDNPAI